MKALSFQKCLDRALQFLGGRKGILYVSMEKYTPSPFWETATETTKILQKQKW